MDPDGAAFRRGWNGERPDRPPNHPPGLYARTFTPCDPRGARDENAFWAPDRSPDCNALPRLFSIALNRSYAELVPDVELDSRISLPGPCGRCWATPATEDEVMLEMDMSFSFARPVSLT